MITDSRRRRRRRRLGQRQAGAVAAHRPAAGLRAGREPVIIVTAVGEIGHRVTDSGERRGRD